MKLGVVRGVGGDLRFGFCDGDGICVWWGLWIERLGGFGWMDGMDIAMASVVPRNDGVCF